MTTLDPDFEFSVFAHCQHCGAARFIIMTEAQIEDVTLHSLSISEACPNLTPPEWAIFNGCCQACNPTLASEAF